MPFQDNTLKSCGISGSEGESGRGGGNIFNKEPHQIIGVYYIGQKTPHRFEMG